METENKDWKPEVGKTAWLKRYSDKIEQVMITADYTTKLHYKQMIQIGEGEVAEYYSAQDRDYFFESPEAALASIKIYDLEGKEVVIHRAIHFSGICSECGSSIALDAKQTNAMEKLAEAAYNMQLGDIPRAKPIPMRTIEEENAMLSPSGEKFLIDKQEYFDWCLRNEDTLCMFLDSKIRGGAAIGGESDQREGGR